MVARVTDDATSTLVSYYLVVGTAGDDINRLVGRRKYSCSDGGCRNSGLLGTGWRRPDYCQVGITLPLVIWGNAGNDQINTSAVAVPVELDGGSGNDTLTSGNGADTLRAGAGTNVLSAGNGRNLFVGGGNDTLSGGADDDTYEIHFSTVIVNDVGGGLDTVSLAGSPAGVTLDFSSTSGSSQIVFPTSTPTDSYHGSTLALNGTFQRLVGSVFGDVLSTSTTNTQIDGGDGNDQLSGSGAGIALDGGSGNDTLVLQNTSGSIQGGGGNDTIIGSLNSLANNHNRCWGWQRCDPSCWITHR